MSPTIQEQLAVQAEHDRNLQYYKDNPQATPKPEAPTPATELDLEDKESDPFGGNLNNRRVAERVAAQKSPEFLNWAAPTHGGDPVKAREDIARSKEINPDPVLPPTQAEGDVMLPASVPTGPTPGSPAAEAAATANPPSAPLPPGAPGGPPAAPPTAPKAPAAPGGKGWKRNA